MQLPDAGALTQDIGVVCLRCGDLGAMVELLAPGAFAIEFVAASGRTQALLTSTAANVRQLGDRDLMAARTLEAVGA